MELKCAVQQYEWGKIGRHSEVANLASGNDDGFKINDTAAYAEYWLGTHPNGASIIKNTGQKLGDWIKEHPDCLGVNTKKRFGNELPFLFKVLSINKALSIQAHPAKEHAEQLYQQRPDLYKDPNHKPELAIALTPFEALCGFRPVQEIKQYLSLIPELCAVIGPSASSDFVASDGAGQKTALQNMFRSLMTCPKETIEAQLSILLTRLRTLDKMSQTNQQAGLLQTLHSQFPGDVGCFNIYLLNVLTLQPGEALYLGPNEPHAYLSGDCIECMACSDNVVRAGLTPKFKDVETLCEMLTYICNPAESKRFQGQQEDKFTKLFSPPVPDFAVALIKIPGGIASYSLVRRASASIIIIIEGSATTEQLSLKRGSAAFLSANEQLTLNIGRDGIIISQAMSNL